jgi:tRNA (guanine-N7-)-methyltransferase
LPSGLLELVTIQFPDPWFKKKHQKRRVLQPALLRGIAAALAPGGTLFLQSDVPAVLAAMVGPVEACGGFERLEPCPATGENPLPVATERETLVLSRGLPVYRATYHRNAQPLANPRAAPGPLAGGGGPADNPGGAGASPAPVPPV